MKKYIAELLGTFALTLVVGLSLDMSAGILTPILAGFTLMLFAYSIGSISGAHINPAVTIGAWSIGKISWIDAGKYIVAQFGGAALALLVVGSEPSSLPVQNSWQIFLAEGAGMFFFTFGIASVIYGKVSSGASGLVVGGSLLLGIAIAAMLGSNGVLNPAVALGIHSFSVMYVIAPLVGSILGMQIYKQLQS